VTLAVDGQPFSVQRTERFRAPDRTSDEPPRQMHLDILVDGHPFCLVTPEGLTVTKLPVSPAPPQP
jgi:hypothetical protein